MDYVYLERSTHEPIGVEEARTLAIDEKDYYQFPHDAAMANLMFYPGGLL